ncbi:hypothetical protein IEO21_06969 [Rhodonia placenta]|uniref:Uncharacterized protein n=1 Tax=Rhodonia placenta TaxID=104341 RepID=A0A8H7NZ22_9APHY|nr:hypothetical protein IEO21_06969 [Postia placenta]
MASSGVTESVGAGVEGSRGARGVARRPGAVAPPGFAMPAYGHGSAACRQTQTHTPRARNAPALGPVTVTDAKMGGHHAARYRLRASGPRSRAIGESVFVSGRKHAFPRAERGTSTATGTGDQRARRWRIARQERRPRQAGFGQGVILSWPRARTRDTRRWHLRTR